jgi:hypothetical protein
MSIMGFKGGQECYNSYFLKTNDLYINCYLIVIIIYILIDELIKIRDIHGYC